MPTLQEDMREGIDKMTALTETVEGEVARIRAANAEGLGQMDAKKVELGSQVAGFVADADNRYFSEMANLRLTNNQALVPNPEGNFPVAWSPGYCTAEEVEYVVSGVVPTERSALAREFLQALNSDVQHFAGGFRIWRLTFTAGSGDYGMYQYVRTPNSITTGAIVKHESGDVPYGSWCTGLVAGEKAKWCGLVGGGGNSYTHIHPFIGTAKSGVVLVALPASVTGRMGKHGDGKVKWGQFPLIISNGQDADHGYGIYD